MSAQNTTSTAPTKKRRSPVERTIVWGLIAVLLVVVLWEGWARFGYSRTLDRWQSAIEAAEGADSSGGVTQEKAEALITGSPSKSEPQQQGRFQTVTYRWKSLLKEYSIAVTYVGDPPEITNLETAGAPEEEQPDVVNVPDEWVEEPSGAPSGEQPAGEPQTSSAEGDEPSAEQPAPAEESNGSPEPSAEQPPAGGTSAAADQDS